MALGGTPILGGCEDTTEENKLPADAPVPHVNATAIFGGVGVKNKVDGG